MTGSIGWILQPNKTQLQQECNKSVPILARQSQIRR
jgi:hypothetical protein